MGIKVEGFNEVFDILKNLSSAVKSTLNIPASMKKEMYDAIAATAELIDETLVVLKQHLTGVISELRFGDKQRAAQMIYQLGDFQGWEAKYRQFQLCDALRLATNNLERKGLYKLQNVVAFSDSNMIQQRMFDYIGGEVNAARSVGTMLMELSQLAAKVDSGYDMVVAELEQARAEVARWRQSFIDLEIEIRNAV